MSQVLTMSSTYFGWVQCPVLQSQTTLPALVKHQHILDNSLLKNSLNFGSNIGLVFTKPESTARDSRNPTQQIRGCTHSNFNNETPFSESAAVKTGLVGPLPLIKIADLIGFDDATRPGPSQRTEQQLIEYFGQNFSCCKFFELSPVQIFSRRLQLLSRPRKGIPLHAGLVDGILAGMGIKPDDRVIFIDILPNRQGCVHSRFYFVISIFSQHIERHFVSIMEVKFELSTALRFRLLVGPGLWSLDARSWANSGR